MRTIIKFILIILIFTNCTPDAKNYVIDISSDYVDTRDLKINIKTNFPDGTSLLVNVGRIHFQKGMEDEYIGNIYSEDILVKNGKIDAVIHINDSKWYNEHQRLLKALPDDIKPIEKISEHITISVLFSPKREQSDNILQVTGINGEYVGGEGAESKYNFTTFTSSKEIKIPFLK